MSKSVLSAELHLFVFTEQFALEHSSILHLASGHLGYYLQVIAAGKWVTLEKTTYIDPAGTTR